MIQFMIIQGINTYHKLSSINQERLLALLDPRSTNTVNSLGCLHAIGGEVVGVASRDASVLGCVDETVLTSQ